MTTKLITILIAGVMLAGSAAASFQATDASSSPALVSGGCHSGTGPATPGGSPGVGVGAPTSQCRPSRGGRALATPRAPPLRVNRAPRCRVGGSSPACSVAAFG